MIFSQLILNKKIWEHFYNAFDNGRLPHALLLHGSQGVGKEAHAMELAALLNCNNLQNKGPCGNCSSCNKTKSFKHENVKLVLPFPRGGISSSKDSPLKAFKNEKAFQDYLDLLKEKSDDPYLQMRVPNANTILINSIRDLKQDVLKSTINNGWKVVMIFQAEKLCVPSPAAAHALLKILEEPPDQTIMILVSSNPNMILDTIRSRCQHFHFPPIPNQIIQSRLEEKGQASDQAAIISRISNGNITLSRELALNYEDLMKKVYVLLNSCFSKDPSIWEKCIEILSTLKRKDIYLLEQLFYLTILFFRDLHYYASTGVVDDIIYKNHVDKIKKLCQSNPNGDWQTCIQHIENTRNYILRNGNMSLMTINMIIDMQMSIQGKFNDTFKLSDWIAT